MRRFLRRTWVLGVLMAGFIPIFARQESVPAGPRTIATLLDEHGFDDVSQLPADVARLVVEYGPATSLNDDREFVFAGYAAERSPEGILTDRRLHLVLADRVSNSVRYGTIDLDGAAGLGSVSRIFRTDNYIYISTHLTPSAENTVVLDEKLNFHGTVYGWVLGALSGDAVVFHHSMIHFAPTHPGRASVYDPATGTERDLPAPPLRSGPAGICRPRPAGLRRAWGGLVSEQQPPHGSGELRYGDPRSACRCGW